MPNHSLQEANLENAVAGGRECQLMGYPCAEDEVQVGVTKKLAEYGLQSKAAEESFFKSFILPFFAGIGFVSMVWYAYDIFNGKKGMNVRTSLLNDDEI